MKATSQMLVNAAFQCYYVTSWPLAGVRMMFCTRFVVFLNFGVFSEYIPEGSKTTTSYVSAAIIGSNFITGSFINLF